MFRFWSVISCVLMGLFTQDSQAITIQALIDLDNDSEDLITHLINKVDGIIDPKVIDSKNATEELAYALLRLGPLVTVNGNITDGTKGFTLSFSFNAKAAVSENTSVTVERSVGPNFENKLDEELLKSEGGVLQPVVQYLEPYLITAVSIIFNGVMSNVIANFMHEVSLLSSTNIC